jgi:hypothetical protein
LKLLNHFFQQSLRQKVQYIILKGVSRVGTKLEASGHLPKPITQYENHFFKYLFWPRTEISPLSIKTLSSSSQVKQIWRPIQSSIKTIRSITSWLALKEINKPLPKQELIELLSS